MSKDIKVSTNKNASKEYVWKFGILINHGIDKDGKCNYASRQITFLGVSDKRPTYKFIKETFNLRDVKVITRSGSIKLQNTDIIILKRFSKGKKSSMFDLF